MLLSRAYLLSFIFMFSYGFLQAQGPFRVLHYTETSGFNHGTRQNSLAMLQTLGVQHGFTVDDDSTGAAFDSLSGLQQYAVVVFSNTSGNQILDSAQRASFEAYINGGGSFVGIHAASDTYRHSTANGFNTGTWDWYAELVGGSVQESPNHTTPNYNGIMDVVQIHPTIANIPDPWSKVEEYYYWENGFLDTSIIPVLDVRPTGSNSYDTTRPMSWYKVLPGEGRSFYTALGHANANYTSDTSFRNHIRNAILWAAGQTNSVAEAESLNQFRLYPNPTNGLLKITGLQGTHVLPFRILDLSGRTLKEGRLKFDQGQAELDVQHMGTGQYILEIGSDQGTAWKRLLFIVR